MLIADREGKLIHTVLECLHLICDNFRMNFCKTLSNIIQTNLVT